MENNKEKRDPLLEELQERIEEGPILFTPDEEWIDLLNEEDLKEIEENDSLDESWFLIYTDFIGM